MKKLFLVLAFITAISTFSCTPNSIAEDEANTTLQSIDKDEVCPPSDRNCNGIPDWKE